MPTREGFSSPPYYRPSPQQYLHHQHPDFGLSMYPASPVVVPTPPGGPSAIMSGGGRLAHPQQHAPPAGGGGLYSMGDIPSPPSSFHMSMVDTSTPTNMSMRGGGGAGIPPHLRSGMGGGVGGGDVSGIRDLNNYLPVHKIRVEEDVKRLFTVENNVTRETIVVLTSSSKIIFYMLKVKDGQLPSSEKFEFVRFHELFIEPHDLEAFTISQTCSITLIPFQLTYALSTRGCKSVFIYEQGNSNQIPSKLKIEDAAPDNNTSAGLISLEHDYPVTHLALDSEKDYLACVQELGTIYIWDIPTMTKMAVFHIPNQCIYVSFHRSEPFQLLVIDSSGWARYFNVFRQRCFRSISIASSVLQEGVFSADWSTSNSDIVAAGFAEAFTVIDTSKMISSWNKCFEVPEQVINAVKINPMDDKVYATLGRLSGTIQLWRDNFRTHIWKHRNTHVNDIAWVHGHPYVLALGHQRIFIYDTAIS